MMKKTNGISTCGSCAAGHAASGHAAETGRWRSGATALLFAAGLAMQYAEVGFFRETFVRLVWYLTAYLPVGLPVLREAWRGIRCGDFFTEYTLMSLAAAGAFGIGEYPEGVAVMLFYSVGEMLQERAVERARSDIGRLVDVRPVQARVVRGGRVDTVAASEVVPGDMIEVLPGGRVPLDGVMRSEKAPFDTAALTGESTPRTLREGEEVLAGMICTERPVRIEVTRPYDRSALSRILEMIGEAARRKAPAELFIRRFARVYTPVVTGLALLIVFVPWLWSLVAVGSAYSLHEWLSRALVFLVASCPCALVISVPLGYFSGIGIASKAGILFKGGRYLDRIARVNTVLFDKTGTLTEGAFEVREVRPAEGMETRRLLALVASAERHSTHPIARAIVRRAEREGISFLEIGSSSEIAGYGIEAVAGRYRLLVGNTRMMKRFGIEYPPELDDVAETIVVCGIDGRYAGYILAADAPKEDAVRAVSELKTLGIEDIRILSGDRQALVAALGRQLRTTEATGDLLPEGKMRVIERLRGTSGRVTAFVGDGFNDAPALAMSDVGVAMGGVGSDAAIETADVVIQSDRPSRLPAAIRIGRLTRRIVRQNISLAIGVKAVVLILGALGLANMWEAVFADVGVTLLAVLNVVRIARRRF